MSAVTSSPLPRPRASIVWTALPDGAVLFAPETEVYFSLNAVGALVWDLLGEHCASLDELCARVVEAFPDAPADLVRDDVAALLGELRSAGLVEGDVA